MASFLDQYNRLTRFPFGKFVFNKAIGVVSPYFGTIHPEVMRLTQRSCIVRIKDRRKIRNHIGTVNAGAMCTLAELTAGMAVDATIPQHLRWIPRKMSVEYLAKARGTLEAVCEIDEIALQEGDRTAAVSVRNHDKIEVFRAEITFYISRKKKP